MKYDFLWNFFGNFIQDFMKVGTRIELSGIRQSCNAEDAPLLFILSRNLLGGDWYISFWVLILTNMALHSQKHLGKYYAKSIKSGSNGKNMIQIVIFGLDISVCFFKFLLFKWKIQASFFFKFWQGTKINFSLTLE